MTAFVFQNGSLWTQSTRRLVVSSPLPIVVIDGGDRRRVGLSQIVSVSAKQSRLSDWPSSFDGEDGGLVDRLFCGAVAAKEAAGQTEEEGESEGEGKELQQKKDEVSFEKGLKMSIRCRSFCPSPFDCKKDEEKEQKCPSTVNATAGSPLLSFLGPFPEAGVYRFEVAVSTVFSVFSSKNEEGLVVSSLTLTVVNASIPLLSLSTGPRLFATSKRLRVSASCSPSCSRESELLWLFLAFRFFIDRHY